MKRALVAFAESVAIILKCRRRHGWVAESGMTIDIRSKAPGHIAAGCVEAIMESALSDVRVCRGRWRDIINNFPMRTTCDGQR